MGRVLRFNNQLESEFNRWRQRAACKEWPTEWWYPNRHSDQRIPKGICAECPVRSQCLDYAMTRPEPHGIWGGLNERERKRLRREAS